jgi:hypothetical protein
MPLALTLCRSEKVSSKRYDWAVIFSGESPSSNLFGDQEFHRKNSTVVLTRCPLNALIEPTILREAWSCEIDIHVQKSASEKIFLVEAATYGQND